MNWEINKVNGGYWLYKDCPGRAFRKEDVWVFINWEDVVMFLYKQLHAKNNDQPN